MEDAKDPAAKIAVAQRLLEEGRKSTKDRAQQFTLLRRASEVASSAGETDLVLEAVDAIATAGFKIDPYQVKARLLKRLVEQNASATADQHAAISAACVRFVESAAANGAIDAAVEVLNTESKSLAEPSRRAQGAARAATAAANHARTPADRTEKAKKAEEAQSEADALKAAQAALVDCGKGIQQARRDFDAVRAAEDRLAANPDDADACLVVGRWYCFSRGDWEKGLNLLAKGSDASLKSVAAAEVGAKPTTADEKVALGDSGGIRRIKPRANRKPYQAPCRLLVSGCGQRVAGRRRQGESGETPRPAGGEHRWPPCRRSSAAGRSALQ